jgi:RNA polymerase sigma factor (sigma-70 family)
MERDEELVAAALGGVSSAFGILIARHRGRVRAVADALLDDREEAEDVVQEALLLSYLGLDRLRDPARFANWVCGIAANLAKMRLRRRKDVLAPAVAAEPSPHERVESGELLRAVLAALEILPSHEREAVLMHYVDDLSAGEIAELVGEAPGTIRVRLHRARRRLRAELLGKEQRMIEVTVDDVIVRVLQAEEEGQLPRLAKPWQRIVLLREKEGDRVLPIWIGAPEGDMLAFHLHGASTPRPMTPDLTTRLLDAAGARIERVAVTRLEENTFYATITLVVGESAHEIDARPSDAVNLALRAGVSIFVDEEVMAAQAVTEIEDGVEARIKEHGEEPGPGEWRSLSPELIKLSPMYAPPPK